MTQRVNIVELARHCNTSTATVSRVFSGATNVRHRTREKVLAAARSLNYTPQQTARKHGIALVVHSQQSIRPPSWYASMLVTTLMQEINIAGLIPQLVNAEDAAQLLPSFTTAALIMDWRPRIEMHYREAIDQRIPLIGINMVIPGAYAVRTDHHASAYDSMRYLIARGHRRIAWLDKGSKDWGGSQRLVGYRDALAEAGLPFDESLICPEDITGALPLDGLSALLAAGATALVCLHEDWVMPLNYYLQALGKRVPADVSVIAAEIPALCQWLTPPWTAVEQDLSQLARAVTDLIGRIADGSEPPPADDQRQAITINDRLIERRSVKDLAG